MPRGRDKLSLVVKRRPPQLGANPRAIRRDILGTIDNGGGGLDVGVIGLVNRGAPRPVERVGRPGGVVLGAQSGDRLL